MWGLERMGRLYSHNQELFAETLMRGDGVMYSGIRETQNNLTKHAQTRLWDPFHSIFRALCASLRLDFIQKVTRSQQEFMFVSLHFAVQDF